MDSIASTAGVNRPSEILVPPGRPAAPVQSPVPARAPLDPAVQVELSGEAGKPAPERGAEPAERHFTRDPDSKELVYQIMDPISGEVFAQLPDEATLRARIYARELQARASADLAQATVAIA
jgi:flagellar protein FlaG